MIGGGGVEKNGEEGTGKKRGLSTRKWAEIYSGRLAVVETKLGRFWK